LSLGDESELMVVARLNRFPVPGVTMPALVPYFLTHMANLANDILRLRPQVIISFRSPASELSCNVSMRAALTSSVACVFGQRQYVFYFT
jgi:hypothetical protein